MGTGASGHSGQTGAWPIWEPVFMGSHLEPRFVGVYWEPEATGAACDIRPVLGCVGVWIQRNIAGATSGLRS